MCSDLLVFSWPGERDKEKEQEPKRDATVMLGVFDFLYLAG